MGFKFNLKYIGKKLRPEAILDITKGGSKAKKEWRRLGNMGSGAVSGAITGFKTGGPIGAILGAAGGGVHGYQDKDAATGRNLLQNAGKGALIGYGVGSGANALGSGGSGWTLGLGKAATGSGQTFAGQTLPSGQVATTASQLPANAAVGLDKSSLISELLQAGLSGMLNGGQQGQQAQEYDPNDPYKIPELYRSRY